MELNIGAYIGQKLNCTCGREHFCPLDSVTVENGALLKLPEILKDYHSMLLVADENTYAACGRQVREILGDRVRDVLVYKCDGLLVPDEQAVAVLENALTPEMDYVVGVGSGVINDICKYVTFNRGMKYAIVGTAPSMDGYASSGAAMIMGGMKVTYSAHVPEVIIADVDVLKDAPMELIKSGYGDILGK